MSWSTFAPWQTQYQNEDEKPTPSQSYDHENAPCRLMQHPPSSYVNDSNILFPLISSCGQLFYNTASAVLRSFKFSRSKPEQQRDKPRQLHQHGKIVEQCGADKNDHAPVHNNDLSRAREGPTESLGSALSLDLGLQLLALHQCDFAYDVMAGPPGKSQIRRRMILSFRTDTNFMSTEAHERLGTSIKPYYGAPVSVLRRPDRIPVEIAEEETHERLGTRIEPNHGAHVPDVDLELQDGIPIGIAEVLWSFCGRSKPYRTAFYVVEDVGCDLIIGRPSMRQQELYEVDPPIATRLLKSCRCC
ncbi:hypothetical protein ABHI18_010864 [Aspergillus niger]